MGLSGFLTEGADSEGAAVVFLPQFVFISCGETEESGEGGQWAGLRRRLAAERLLSLLKARRLTCTPAQVLDVDLLLLHARRLSDQARVVVGAPVGGAHGVLVVAAAVDVADTPAGSQRQLLACG